MVTQRTIPVTSELTPIEVLDKQGQKLTLGHVVEDNFNGEAKKFTFMPDTQNPFIVPKNKYDTGYYLGVGTGKSTHVNPLQVYEVLMENGWEIKTQSAAGAGVDIITTFVNPNIQWPDLWEHDYGYFNKDSELGIFASMQVTTSLTMGRMGAHVTAGLYRVICTNGLVSQIYNFGTSSLRHSYTPNEFESFKKIVDTQFPQHELPRGDVAGKQVAPVIRLLKRTYESHKAGEEYNAPFNFAPFKDLRQPVFKKYTELLEGAGAEVGTLHVLDIMNAYTSAVNASINPEKEVQGPWYTRSLGAMERVVNSTKVLLQMAAMFSDN